MNAVFMVCLVSAVSDEPPAYGDMQSTNEFIII
jgi:hypothetical protein